MSPAPDPDGAGASGTCVLSMDAHAVRAGLAHMTAGPPLSRLTPDQRGTVEVVLAEVLNNIAEHAYAGGPGKITVTLGLIGAGLACQVIDDGGAMPVAACRKAGIRCNIPDQRRILPTFRCRICPKAVLAGT